MTEYSKDIEKVWAYVHHELSEEEHCAMEEALRKDDRLRKMVEDIRSMNRELAEFVPLTQQTEEELEEAVLKAWEGTTSETFAAPEIEVVARPKERPVQAGILDLFTRPYAIGLAAAAVFMFVVGLQALRPEALTWLPADVSAAGSRGAGEPVDFYTSEEMNAFASQLSTAVDSTYVLQLSFAERHIWRGRSWMLRPVVRQLQDGRILVTVEAYTPGEDEAVGSWSESFAHRESYTLNIQDVGARIVEELYQMVGP